MSLEVPFDDLEWVSYRVKILRHGKTVCTVFIDDMETAIEWAYNEMNIRTIGETNDDVVYAAVVESGLRFEDMIGRAKTIFAPNKMMRQGLVLNVKVLKDLDHKILFGLT